MNKIKDILIETLKMIFDHQIETIKLLFSYREQILYVVLSSLQLWCLNLSFYFTFIIITPLIVQDGFIIESIIKLTKFWFIDGIKFHLWFLGICFLIVIHDLS